MLGHLCRIYRLYIYIYKFCTFTNFYNTEFFLNKTILVVILTIKIIIPKQKKFLEINYEQLNKLQNKLPNE